MIQIYTDHFTILSGINESSRTEDSDSDGNYSENEHKGSVLSVTCVEPSCVEEATKDEQHAQLDAEEACRKKMRVKAEKRQKKGEARDKGEGSVIYKMKRTLCSHSHKCVFIKTVTCLYNNVLFFYFSARQAAHW